jgi:apolipoprotein N-acyltransferase
VSSKNSTGKGKRSGFSNEKVEPNKIVRYPEGGRLPFFPESYLLKTFFMKKKSASANQLVVLSWLALFFGMVGQILSSAKWGIAIFAWISPLCYLSFLSFTVLKRRWIWFFMVQVIGTVIASRDVAPFPLPILLLTSLIHSFKIFIVYLTNEKLVRQYSNFFFTLYFPAAYTLLEYLSAIFSGGAWWSVANSQFAFPWFIQLASVTGIWGISFMIFWFASMFVWTIQRRSSGQNFGYALFSYCVLILMILVYGGIRYNKETDGNAKPTRIAGITAPSFGFLSGLYKDFCGQEINIDPRTSINSPLLQQINKAEIPFIETADTIRFSKGYAAMKSINDSLFSLSSKAVAQGAKIILWSEGNALSFSFNKDQLTGRARSFAAQHGVYLLMARAVIHPGKVEMNSKFLENEALLFGPDGTLLNTFHKNNPVPFAEASVPGDGIIPVIETPYGRLATSICYDADFPVQMRQLGRKQADLLLLPSGDWSAIAPFHSYMAIFRGIENGTSIFRQVSGGLSLASDPRGKIRGSMDFYQRGEKFWIIDFSYSHVDTIYNKIGDLFAWICLAITVLGLLLIAAKYIVDRQTKKMPPAVLA